MAWDDNKEGNDQVRSNDWNDMVSDQKSHASEHEEGGRDEITHNQLQISTDDHHTRFSEDPNDSLVDIPNRDYSDLENREHGNEDHTETFTTPESNVEDFSTNGDEGTVPVSQGDGSLVMEEASGGIEFLNDINEELQSERKAFNTIRNRRDWIEYILNKDETKADEITSSQVLTNYVFEAENDKYDRFIDPNISLGMMAFNQENEPSLTSVYEVALFFAPSTFLEGLMSYEDLADHITDSEVLMDGIMEGDKILENQFGKTANA